MVKSVSVVGYHPEIAVRKLDGSVVVIKVDLDDWYDDEEVFPLLADQVSSDCKTVGDVVAAIGNGELSPGGGVISARIVEVEGSPEGVVRGWGDSV